MAETAGMVADIIDNLRRVFQIPPRLILSLEMNLPQRD